MSFGLGSPECDRYLREPGLRAVLLQEYLTLLSENIAEICYVHMPESCYGHYPSGINGYRFCHRQTGITPSEPWHSNSPMALPELFESLDEASHGAYVMDMDRRILLWNRSAERILGHEAEQVVGRQCYEVLFGLPEQPAVPTCVDCLTVRLAESRRIAPVAQVRMRCASGERKRIGVMTLTVPASKDEQAALVHLFHERAPLLSGGESERIISGRVSPAPPMHSGQTGTGRRSAPLTRRELDVVRLLAVGEAVASICRRLHLSEHTVLNHIRNARERLDVANRLELVIKVQRLGLL